MIQPFRHAPEYVSQMADGTIKQINPFSGTEVWTVPGRGNRPLGIRQFDPVPLDPADHARHCSFCSERYTDTPPEKSRLVKHGDGRWETIHRVSAAELFDTVAEFRRIPNLFEILSFDYWHQNYGYVVPDWAEARKAAYLADPAGLAHVLKVIESKLRASGKNQAEIDAMTVDAKLEAASGFFGGGHDVIVARRHYVDGATDDSQAASSGTLTPEEHYRFMAFTIDAIRALYDVNRYARYVAVFQNWLKPAGASFDHLHKQLVAIDERGVQHENALARLRANPNVFNEDAVNYASYKNLVIAENEHAIMFAGFGHRYPTVEVYSKSERSDPWEQSEDEVRAMSNLVHAAHAATGRDVPCNEEWYYRPADADLSMPWRVMLKWRISTLAGFEGATKIYLNTLSPSTVRDRVVNRLFALRSEGRIAGDLQIAFEAACRPNPLRYNKVAR